MAESKYSSCMFLSTGFLFFVLHFSAVVSVEFKVGGVKGWVIPPSDDVELFNEWASKNRFKINDTLRFVYEKDSVMEVSQDEYEKCQSSHPLYFNNNGNTSYTFDRGGLFYFISGVRGHCQRRLKMIIKVLDPEILVAAPPPAAGGQTGSDDKSGAVELKSSSSYASVITAAVMFISSMFGSVFFI